MLVVSRREGEKIFVGDVMIVITQIQGMKCRVGIEAPKHVPITRDDAKLKTRRSALPANIEGSIASNGQLTRRQ